MGSVDEVTARAAINAAEDKPRQDGFIYLTSVETAATISITVKHDGADGSTGVCYSVNGGAAVYGAIAANTNLTINPPTAGGGAFSVEIWPATSTTSGRVGNLTYFDCSGDEVTSLDVSNCPTLTYLNCYSNQLTSVDVSNNTALTTLSCYSNQLTSVDVSNNTALTALNCGDNQLTSVDVSNNTALTTLSCPINQLTSLDVSNNTALTSLNCYSNQLTELILPETGQDWEGAYVQDNLLTSVRCVGFTSSYSGGSTYYLALDLSNNNLSAAALDQAYADVGAVSGPWIRVDGNSGTSGDDPSIATAKGWTVYGS
jgi:hypothetical protein